VYPGAWLVIYRLFYAAFLATAALGAVAAWQRADRVGRQRLVLLLVFLGSVSVAQSLFYVEVRHRWAVEPILGIFVAAAVGVVAAGKDGVPLTDRPARSDDALDTPIASPARPGLVGAARASHLGQPRPGEGPRGGGT